jgi:hypothetical protein
MILEFGAGILNFGKGIRLALSEIVRTQDGTNGKWVGPGVRTIDSISRHRIVRALKIEGCTI